jgi:hypothetical protein
MDRQRGERIEDDDSSFKIKILLEGDVAVYRGERTF